MNPLQILAKDKMVIEERAAAVTKAYQELITAIKGSDQYEGSNWKTQDRLNIPYPSIIINIEHWGEWHRTHNSADEEQYYLDKDDAATIETALKELAKNHPALNFHWEEDDCEFLIIVIETKQSTAK